MSQALRSYLLPGSAGSQIFAEEDSLTGFVLEEQGDWFESELSFARKLMSPGWKCVDAGASYGCYSFSLAACVGQNGSVVAIEPHPRVLAAFQKSIAASPYSARLSLEGCALGSRAAEGRLTDPRDVELAALSSDGVIPVAVETLDSVVSGKIDYLKVDVEGDGAAVLMGADRLLSSGRTIVQFVLRHGGVHQSRAISLLMSKGYLIFRLLPGIGALTPLLPGEGVDPFTINAYAIPPDRLGDLALRGLIIDTVDETSALPEGVRVQDVIDGLAKESWIAHFCPNWQPNAIIPGWEHQRRAVAMSVLSEKMVFSAAHRAACLVQALSASRRALNSGITGSRLATAARIMCNQGSRAEASRAIDALSNIAKASPSDLTGAFSEPFVLPLKQHENQGFDSLVDMIRCATSEAAAFVPSFSAFFQGASRLHVYEQICSLPGHSLRSDRVLDMLHKMNKRQAPIALRL